MTVASPEFPIPREISTEVRLRYLTSWIRLISPWKERDWRFWRDGFLGGVSLSNRDRSQEKKMLEWRMISLDRRRCSRYPA